MKIIEEKNLLRKHNLSRIKKDILLTSIKHHLLIGTIFTGESSYFGSIDLYSDINQYEKKISEKEFQILLDGLYSFSLIDIWGYDYGEIHNHYFEYYSYICDNLYEIFKFSNPLENKIRQNFGINPF